jgi:hypothetical protein
MDGCVHTSALAEQRLASPDQGEPLRSVELARDNCTPSLDLQATFDRRKPRRPR